MSDPQYPILDAALAVVAAARRVDDASAEIPVDADKVWGLCEELHTFIEDYDNATNRAVLSPVAPRKEQR